MMATMSAVISAAVSTREYMPELVAISDASLVQSANVPRSLLISESSAAAPVTRSPSASRMGNTTVNATPLLG